MRNYHFGGRSNIFVSFGKYGSGPVTSLLGNSLPTSQVNSAMVSTNEEKRTGLLGESGWTADPG